MNTSKLFRVLVLGGCTLALTGCGAESAPEGVAVGADAGTNVASVDAGAPADAGDTDAGGVPAWVSWA